MVDLDEGRALRSSLVATVGAQKLEERLADHLPDATVASRGCICRLRLPANLDGIEQIGAALPLVRDSAGVVHLPPHLLQPLLREARLRPGAALLRADLARDRALTALAARELMVRGLRVSVLKRPLGRLAGRAALLGVPIAHGALLPTRTVDRLIRADERRADPRTACGG